jgi:hypothetical protein
VVVHPTAYARKHAALNRSLCLSLLLLLVAQDCEFFLTIAIGS